MNKPWLNYTDNSIGEPLHAALRKCCDSIPTSAAWNAIHILGGAWKWYLDGLLPKLKEAKIPAEVVIAARDTANEYSARSKNERKIPKDIHTEVMVLCLIFKMFDLGDWHGFVSFIVE